MTLPWEGKTLWSTLPNTPWITRFFGFCFAFYLVWLGRKRHDLSISCEFHTLFSVPLGDTFSSFLLMNILVWAMLPLSVQQLPVWHDVLLCSSGMNYLLCGSGLWAPFLLPEHPPSLCLHPLSLCCSLDVLSVGGSGNHRACLLCPLSLSFVTQCLVFILFFF